jgi:hypothetical protein
MPRIIAAYHDLGYAFVTRGNVQYEMSKMKMQSSFHPWADSIGQVNMPSSVGPSVAPFPTDALPAAATIAPPGDNDDDGECLQGVGGCQKAEERGRGGLTMEAVRKKKKRIADATVTACKRFKKEKDNAILKNRSCAYGTLPSIIKAAEQEFELPAGTLNIETVRKRVQRNYASSLTDALPATGTTAPAGNKDDDDECQQGAGGCPQFEEGLTTEAVRKENATVTACKRFKKEKDNAKLKNLPCAYGTLPSIIIVAEQEFELPAGTLNVETVRKRVQRNYASSLTDALPAAGTTAPAGNKDDDDECPKGARSCTQFEEGLTIEAVRKEKKQIADATVIACKRFKKEKDNAKLKNRSYCAHGTLASIMKAAEQEFELPAGTLNIETVRKRVQRNNSSYLTDPLPTAAAAAAPGNDDDDDECPQGTGGCPKFEEGLTVEAVRKENATVTACMRFKKEKDNAKLRNLPCAYGTLPSIIIVAEQEFELPAGTLKIETVRKRVQRNYASSLADALPTAGTAAPPEYDER